MAEMVETYRGTVYPWHCDHMDHMNVMGYVGKFDEGTWNFFSMLGLTASKLRSGEVHLAAVQQNIGYRKELYPGDTIAVRSGVLELREKVLRFRHELYNTENGEVASTCEFTVVCLDPQARKSRPFPAECAVRARGLTIEEA